MLHFTEPECMLYLYQSACCICLSCSVLFHIFQWRVMFMLCYAYICLLCTCYILCFRAKLFNTILYGSYIVTQKAKQQTSTVNDVRSHELSFSQQSLDFWFQTLGSSKREHTGPMATQRRPNDAHTGKCRRATCAHRPLTLARGF